MFLTESTISVGSLWRFSINEQLCVRVVLDAIKCLVAHDVKGDP